MKFALSLLLVPAFSILANIQAAAISISGIQELISDVQSLQGVITNAAGDFQQIAAQFTEFTGAAEAALEQLNTEVLADFNDIETRLSDLASELQTVLSA
jgi:hypothetical protein